MGNQRVLWISFLVCSHWIYFIDALWIPQSITEQSKNIPIDDISTQVVKFNDNFTVEVSIELYFDIIKNNFILWLSQPQSPSPDSDKMFNMIT